VLASAFGAGSGAIPIAFYSFGALVGPLHRTFGWSLPEITAAPLFLTIGGLVAGVLAGALADRFGARRVIVVSQIALIAAFVGLSRLTGSLGLFYVGYAALAILGAGTMTMTWSRAITGWFVAGRGLALGLSLVGTGLIGAVLPSYVSFLAGKGGISLAYLGLAVIPLVFGLPLTLLFFHEPEDVDGNGPGSASHDASAGQDFRLRVALGTRCFWQMSIAFMVLATAISALMVHAIPLLTDRGVNPATAAALAGLIGVSVTIGRLISGFLLDHLPGPLVAFAMFITPTLSCLILVSGGNNLWLCGLAIALVGLAGGAEHDMAAYFCASYFGHRHYGKIYGLLYSLYGIGSGIGPLLAGKAHGLWGSYDRALLLGAAMFALSALLIVTLRPPLAIERHHMRD
jgi:MFS family permease